MYEHGRNLLKIMEHHAAMVGKEHTHIPREKEQVIGGCTAEPHAKTIRGRSPRAGTSWVLLAACAVTCSCEHTYTAEELCFCSCVWSVWAWVCGCWEKTGGEEGGLYVACTAYLLRQTMMAYAKGLEEKTRAQEVKIRAGKKCARLSRKQPAEVSGRTARARLCHIM